MLQAEFSFQVMDGVASITVSALDPDTLWTLCTFQTNEFDRSHSPVCVTAQTQGNHVCTVVQCLVACAVVYVNFPWQTVRHLQLSALKNPRI